MSLVQISSECENSSSDHNAGQSVDAGLNKLTSKLLAPQTLQTQVLCHSEYKAEVKLTHQRPRITNADKTLPFFSALRLDIKFNLITLKNTYCIDFDKCCIQQ